MSWLNLARLYGDGPSTSEAKSNIVRSESLYARQRPASKTGSLRRGMVSAHSELMDTSGLAETSASRNSLVRSSTESRRSGDVLRISQCSPAIPRLKDTRQHARGVGWAAVEPIRNRLPYK